VGVPLPLAATVQQMLRQLRAAGHGEEDDSALLRVVEAAARHRIGGGPAPSV
jgi:3-hydroxyisobutyrate dehydrogenase-like beta-hydroxyacid dehydrogenase